jgi:hypothetical protein
LNTRSLGDHKHSKKVHADLKQQFAIFHCLKDPSMNTPKESLTPEELKKKAYSIGLKLKTTGLDAETIYARLEKQGVPQRLALQVAKDVMIERKKENIGQLKTNYNAALIALGIGLTGAFIAWFVFPDHKYIPSGIIGGAIATALMTKKKIV